MLKPYAVFTGLGRGYRLKCTTSESNGLGLYIADEIAKVHKIRLDLSNSQDHETSPRGLRISLTLQLENPHVTALKASFPCERIICTRT